MADQNPPITIADIESVLQKALHKIQKYNNPSEQNSGIGLINRASKMAKAYAQQNAEANAQDRFTRMQDYKLHYRRKIQKGEDSQ